ncbi:YehS family protein [Anditalea andensis]|uniref:DUF1456 family protein n=1 Tax=Anditalea andensis TaxID=1048983 RepID=A0A074KQT6_9BACT|nr:DUF1456 family protein [Anditalea andensis]KEO72316.1 hypothetical protein EL17_16335 [Anditalea andensis]
MTNNDILRNLRYTFDLGDAQMMAIFAQADQTVSRSEVSNWLKKDDDPDFQEMNDRELAIFLNGFINEKRGKKEGVQPEAEERLTNNNILRKLKIALNLKDEDMLSILESVDRRISKHELSAFFRKPGQPQYRPALDQILRNFLHGLQIKYRGN